METNEILIRLRKSPFVYTEAQKIRSELKKLDEYEIELAVRRLRIEKTRPENSSIARAIDEILFNLPAG